MYRNSHRTPVHKFLTFHCEVTSSHLLLYSGHWCCFRAKFQGSGERFVRIAGEIAFDGRREFIVKELKISGCMRPSYLLHLQANYYPQRLGERSRRCRVPYCNRDVLISENGKIHTSHVTLFAVASRPSFRDGVPERATCGSNITVTNQRVGGLNA